MFFLQLKISKLIKNTDIVFTASNENDLHESNIYKDRNFDSTKFLEKRFFHKHKTNNADILLENTTCNLISTNETCINNDSFMQLNNDELEKRHPDCQLITDKPPLLLEIDKEEVHYVETVSNQSKILEERIDR